MTSNWSLSLSVQSKSYEDTKALADALVTDEEIEWSATNENFVFHLSEQKAKDLRAMWNTRMRGIIAVDSLLSSLSIKSEGSSTQTH
tara:strand:+ start:2065 stop:2325 length:261 start_codon:yes stop_codon:yes gene_type:complete